MTVADLVTTEHLVEQLRERLRDARRASGHHLLHGDRVLLGKLLSHLNRMLERQKKKRLPSWPRDYFPPDHSSSQTS